MNRRRYPIAELPSMVPSEPSGARAHATTPFDNCRAVLGREWGRARAVSLTGAVAGLMAEVVPQSTHASTALRSIGHACNFMRLLTMWSMPECTPWSVWEQALWPALESAGRAASSAFEAVEGAAVAVRRAFEAGGQGAVICVYLGVAVVIVCAVHVARNLVASSPLMMLPPAPQQPLEQPPAPKVPRPPPAPQQTLEQPPTPEVPIPGSDRKRTNPSCEEEAESSRKKRGRKTSATKPPRPGAVGERVRTRQMARRITS